jgi:hypothetical protein
MPSSIHDDAGFLDATVAAVKVELHKPVQKVGLVHLGTHRLQLIQWSESSPAGQKLLVTQALLYRLGWGWTFTLTTVPGDAVRLRAVFVPVVQSFHALSPGSGRSKAEVPAALLARCCPTTSWSGWWP